MMQSYRLRLVLLGILTLSAFTALLVRLWYLQFEKKEEYVAKLPGTREVFHRFPGIRGRILDVNGVELARNKTVNQINLNLGEIVQAYRDRNKGKLPKTVIDERRGPETDIVAIVKEIVIKPMRELGIDADFTEDALRRHYREFVGQSPFEFKRDVPWELFAQIGEHSHRFPGVSIAQRPIREYPFGALAGPLLGYIRLFDNPKDDPEREMGYKFYEGDDYGIQALEKYLDKYLRGKPGFRKLLVNEHGRLDKLLEERPSGPGDDVYLTIDIRAQYIAEMALREAGVGRGAVVVINPNTGEVIAMVTVPNYDPNRFIPSISKAEYKAYGDDPTHPLINRAIRGYAPGSTFKIPVALAGFLNPGGMNSYYSCDNYVYYGTYKAPCWTVQKGMGGHGSLDLTGAIKNSCNCFFYKYGNDAGIKSIVRIGAMLGMGRRTGIELGPEEDAGIVPGPDWLRTAGGGKWTDALTAQTSIGQSATLASPLQMACAVAAVANGSKSYVPTLIHHRVDRALKASTQFAPQVRADLTKEGIKPGQIELVRKGMWKVVNEPGGTGSRFRSELPEIKSNGGGAGKTGTAQFKIHGVKDNHTWFICFAPYNAPKLAVSVFVQGGNSGGSCAAPVAKRVVERILLMQNGGYKIDPTAIGSVPEAKGHSKFIESIKYPDEDINSIEDVSDDVDSNEDAARESEIVLKPKAVPNTEPTFKTQTDERIPKARIVEKPKFLTNDPNSTNSEPDPPPPAPPLPPPPGNP